MTKAFGIGVSAVLFLSMSSFLIVNSREKKIKEGPIIIITDLEDIYKSVKPKLPEPPKEIAPEVPIK